MKNEYAMLLFEDPFTGRIAGVTEAGDVSTSRKENGYEEWVQQELDLEVSLVGALSALPTERNDVDPKTTEMTAVPDAACAVAALQPPKFPDMRDLASAS